jgi:hypothetical protein
VSLYAHNIQLSFLSEIDKTFDQFLRRLCSLTSSGVKAKTTERKLTAVPHNTWKALGQQSMISLVQGQDGNIVSSGSLIIVDYALNPMVALIFKLEYRGK